MSHMTVGQLTPDLVMTLKIRSTYCRRFSCNGVQPGHPEGPVAQAALLAPTAVEHTREGAAVESRGGHRHTSPQQAHGAIAVSRQRGEHRASPCRSAGGQPRSSLPNAHLTNWTGTKSPGTHLPDREPRLFPSQA